MKNIIIALGIIPALLLGHVLIALPFVFFGGQWAWLPWWLKLSVTIIAVVVYWRNRHRLVAPVWAGFAVAFGGGFLMEQLEIPSAIGAPGLLTAIVASGVGAGKAYRRWEERRKADAALRHD